MRKRIFTAVCTATLLLVTAGTVTACGSRENPSGPVEFPARAMTSVEFIPDALRWGMSMDEALEALGLEDADFTTREERIPAVENTNAFLLTEISCDRFVYNGVRLKVVLSFRTQEGEPQTEVGLTRFYAGLCEDSIETLYTLRDAVDAGPLSFSIPREELTPDQLKALEFFCASAYKEPGDSFSQMGVSAGGGIGTGEEQTGIYYFYRLDGLYPAVLERAGLTG